MRAITFMLAAFVPVLAQGQSSDHNFIRETIPLDEQGTHAITNVTYFDGLGSEEESVTSASGTGMSIYSAKCHDGRGRVSRAYLPVPVRGDLSFQGIDALSASSTSYYNKDNTAFSDYQYDVFGNVVREELPGTAWRQHHKGNSTGFGSNSSADRVLHYEAPLGQNRLIDPQNTKFRYYPAGSLTKETAMDADGHYVVRFRDLFGNVVLERRNIGDTYFVYNDAGQLRYVLTPQYQTDSRSGAHVYEYQYDSRDNLVRKELPGCGPTQFWYDKDRHLTIMQDANLREQGRYRFMLYDRLGRLAVQGLCSRFTLGTYDSPVVVFRQGQSGLLSTDYVSEDKYKGMLTEAELEIVNYYDDYSFLSGSRRKDFAPLSVGSPANATGYQTGSIVRASNGEYVCCVMTYDLKGNVLSVQTKGLGGFVEKTTNSYTFTNQLREAEIDVDVRYGEHFNATVSNTYNRYNDKLAESHITARHGGDSADFTMRYNYDDLGRLKEVIRPVGSGDEGKVTYSYDLHGWTTGITTGSFKEQLYYADGVGVPCYNGNISSQLWQNRDDAQQRGYRFTYDGLNRLTNAAYGETESLTNAAGKYDEQMTYDADGNILTLRRSGLKQNNQYGLIDDLTMTYDGPHLSQVQDRAAVVLRNGSFDFKGTRSDYQYNGNGSLVSDTGKGIALIEYDDSNMPRRIQFTNGNVTEYVFTATGRKLRTVHYTAVPNITVATGSTHQLAKEEILSKDSTDYLMDGKLTLENGRIDKYMFAGGFCQAKILPRHIILPKPQKDNGSITEWWNRQMKAIRNKDNLSVYFYNTDHLGNVREVVEQQGNVAQLNNYYPFGTPYSDAATVKDPDLQPYKYNGKELDRMHGLNWYDYGARMYDPVIGRWTAVDPLAEKYYSISSYIYCLDNPIRFIDLKGEEPGDFFLTTDAAAFDFGMIYNDNSIRENREYGVTIFQVINSKGQIGYTYTTPTIGDESGVVPTSAPYGFKSVATAHTHAASSPQAGNPEYITGDNIFSGARRNQRLLSSEEKMKEKGSNDIGLANRKHLNSYVATPNGSLQKYEYMNGKVKVLSNNMPSDYKDPDRLNNNSSLVEAHPDIDYLKAITNILRYMPTK